MSRDLALLVMASLDSPNDWYMLADAFRDEGRDGDATMIDIDGIDASLINEAKTVLGVS